MSNPFDPFVDAIRRVFPEPPLTSAAAARELGVKPARVHQLVEAGDLQRANVGGRDLFVTAASVRRRKKRTEHRGGEKITTLSLKEIPKVDAPRPLIYDRLADGFRHPSGAPRQHRVHLRAWGGEDGYTVVLVASTSDHDIALLNGPAEETAGAASTLLPQIDLSKTAFVALDRNVLHGKNAYNLTDATFTIGNATDPRQRSFSGRTFTGPEWSRYDDVAEIVPHIGQKPVIFHRSAYTEATVEQHQRTGRPVTFPWDPDGYLRREEQLRLLEGHEGPVFDLLRDLLLDETRLFMNHPMGSMYPASEQREIDDLKYPWVPQGSILRRTHASPAIAEAVDERFADSPEGLRFTPEETEDAWTLLTDLAVESGEFRSAPNPELEGLASGGRQGLLPRTDFETNAVEEWSRLSDRLEEEHPLHPIAVRYIDIEPRDKIMATYLKGFVAHDQASDLADYERTHLQHLRRLYEIEAIGRDMFGRPAVLSRHREIPELTVLEDVRAIPQLREHDEIVGGRQSQSDTPLFVRRERQLIGMIPLHNSLSGGHAFGYGGSGPGDAASSIARTLRASGFEESQIHREAISRRTSDEALRKGGRFHVRVRDLLSEG